MAATLPGRTTMDRGVLTLRVQESHGRSGSSEGELGPRTSSRKAGYTGPGPMRGSFQLEGLSQWSGSEAWPTENLNGRRRIYACPSGRNQARERRRRN